jgi:hypothetical protein
MWDAAADWLAFIKHGIRAHIKHLVTTGLGPAGDTGTKERHLKSPELVTLVSDKEELHINNEIMGHAEEIITL